MIHNNTPLAPPTYGYFICHKKEDLDLTELKCKELKVKELAEEEYSFIKFIEIDFGTHPIKCDKNLHRRY